MSKSKKLRLGHAVGGVIVAPLGGTDAHDVAETMGEARRGIVAHGIGNLEYRHAGLVDEQMLGLTDAHVGEPGGEGGVEVVAEEVLHEAGRGAHLSGEQVDGQAGIGIAIGGLPLPQLVLGAQVVDVVIEGGVALPEHRLYLAAVGAEPLGHVVERHVGVVVEPLGADVGIEGIAVSGIGISGRLGIGRSCFETVHLFGHPADDLALALGESIGMEGYLEDAHGIEGGEGEGRVHQPAIAHGGGDDDGEVVEHNHPQYLPVEREAELILVAVVVHVVLVRFLQERAEADIDHRPDEGNACAGVDAHPCPHFGAVRPQYVGHE